MNPKILLIIADLVRYAATTLAGIILSRSFSKPDFGTFLQGVLLVGTFSMVASTGLPKAVYYFTSSDKNPRQSLYHIFILLAASLVLWFGGLYLAWGYIVKAFSNPLLGQYALIILANFVIRTINTMFGPVLIVLNRVKIIFYIWVSVAILQLVVFSVLGHMGGSLLQLFSCQLFLELFEFTTLLIIAARFIPGKWTGIDRKTMHTMVAYCLPIFLTIILIILSKKVDGFIISSFFDPTQFAVYTRGALEIPIKQLVIYNLASMLMPRIVRLHKAGDSAGITSALDVELRRITVILFPIFFLFVIIHKELIVFLYTAEYASSSTIFLIYLFFILAQFYAYDSILQSINRNGILTIISIATIAVNLGSSFLLIHRLGPLAPALGTLFGLAANSLFCLFYIHKYLGNPVSRWLPWKHLLKLVFASSLPAVLIFLLKGRLHLPNLGILILLPTIYVVITGFLIWKMDVVSSEDKGLLLRGLGQGKTLLAKLPGLGPKRKKTP